MPSKPTLYICIALILLVGWGGWAVRGWYDDSRDLATERTERAADLAVIEKVSQGMAAAREAMQKAKPGYREVRHEITKIEYRDRECLAPDVVRSVNALAQNLPAPAAPMPGDPASPP